MKPRKHPAKDARITEKIYAAEVEQMKRAFGHLLHPDNHYRRVCQLLEDCGGVRFTDVRYPDATVYALRAYRMTPDCGSNNKPAPCHVYVWSRDVELRTFGAPSRPEGGGHCDPWVDVRVTSLPLASFDLAALERAAASLAAVWRTWREVYP